jgi:hypothetical protein
LGGGGAGEELTHWWRALEADDPPKKLLPSDSIARRAWQAGPHTSNEASTSPLPAVVDNGVPLDPAKNGAMLLPPPPLLWLLPLALLTVSTSTLLLACALGAMSSCPRNGTSSCPSFICTLSRVTYCPECFFFLLAMKRGE